MENKKMNSLKIIIIIIDLIILLLLILFGINYLIDKKNNIIYTYKLFEYKVPNNIKFSIIDDKRFKLDLDNAYLIVELYIDKEKQIYEHPEIYHKLLLENGLNVDKPKLVEINGYSVLLFNKIDEKTILCYFATDTAFAYEVEIFNYDESYSIDALKKVIDIFENAEYKYDGVTEYDFDIIDFSKLIEE